MTRTSCPSASGAALFAHQSSGPILMKPLGFSPSVTVPTEPIIDSGPDGPPAS